MKKLMVMAAAALCGAVASAGGIESQNVVGYQTVNSVAGFNFYAPMFRNVDGTKTRIQDIKLGEGAASWADNIQVLDAGFVPVATYYYATADESGFEADGWLADDFSGLADVTLEPGQSVIVETSEPGVDITYAGEVGKDATVVKSVAGFNFVGNNVPKKINVQDMTLGEGAASWTDNIQVLDAGGVPEATYYYATADESGFEADGWLAEDFSGLADVSLEPGQGIIVETSEAEVEITLPSAL